MAQNIEELKNLPQMLRRSRDLYGDKALYIKREGSGFKETTYKEFYQMALYMASGYKELGLVKGDKIFIYADNRMQWMLNDYAFQILGVISVPRGTDTASDELKFILEHSGVNYIMIDTQKAYDKIKDLNLDVKYLSVDKLDVAGKDIPSFDEVMELGKKSFAANEAFINERIDSGIQPDDTVTYIYTSGTTGNPKGVMLSQYAMLRDSIESAHRLLISDKDIFLLVMPIWHVMQRTCEYICQYSGSTCYYSSLKSFLKDLKEIRPTMQIFVPRILEAVYEKITTTVNKGSFIKKGVFYGALGICKGFMFPYQYLTGRAPIYKRRNFFKLIFSFLAVVLLWLPKTIARLVFSTIHKTLGGRMRICVTGGGASPKYLDEFYTAIGVNFLDGYGMTECSPIVGVRHPLKQVRSTIGKALPSLEAKIIDDKGNELPRGQRGEIVLKGPMVMQGYYNNPEATAKTITDGWLHTGDLGVMTRGGEISVVGRIKDTIVLNGGENVEPEFVEGYLKSSTYISGIVVLGQDKKRLSALISPSIENLTEYAKTNNIEYKELDDLVKNEKIIELYKNELELHSAQLKPFEKVFDFRILTKEFEIGDELTQTLKVRRHIIAKKYAKEISELD